MMNRRAWAISAVLAAGCQAPLAPAPPQPVALTPPPAQTPPPIAPPADPRAQTAAKLAEAQAKSIESLIAAKNADPAGVPVIEPARPAARVAPPPAAVPDASVKPPPAPGAAAVARAMASAEAAANPAAERKSDPSPADGFRPVPPLDPAHPPVSLDPAVPANAVQLPAASPATPPPVVADPPHAAVSDDPLDQRLAKKAREYPRDLAPQLDAQLLALLRDEKVPTAEAMAGLNVEDRDVLTSLLDGLTNFRNGIKQDNNLLITRKIRPIVEMSDRLRSRADLSIVNACLCRSAKSYGIYEPLSAKLVAGVSNRVGLYYEVENITPRLDSSNQWTTSMRQDLVLYDENGLAKWGKPNVAVTDKCRNRRRDFFFGYLMELPSTLPVGKYILKITLSDATAGRVGEVSLPITLAPAVPQTPPAPVGPPLPRDGDIK